MDEVVSVRLRVENRMMYKGREVNVPEMMGMMEDWSDPGMFIIS